MHRFASVSSGCQPANGSDARPSGCRGGAELAAVPFALSGLRVLLVSRAADLCAVICAMLEQCGAKVVTTASPDEAVEIVIKMRPDILVSDIETCDESLYPLIGRIRALDPEDGGRIAAVGLMKSTQRRKRPSAFSAGYQIQLPRTVRGAELITMVAILAGRTGNCLDLYPKEA